MHKKIRAYSLHTNFFKEKRLGSAKKSLENA